MEVVLKTIARPSPKKRTFASMSRQSLALFDVSPCQKLHQTLCSVVPPEMCPGSRRPGSSARSCCECRRLPPIPSPRRS